MVRDYAGGVVVYSRARMKLSFVRLVATLLLSGQMLPVGLPLLCDQVQRGTPASCEQRMASHRSGPAVGALTHATPCANPAFCARSEEHTSELQSQSNLVCRLLLEQKNYRPRPPYRRREPA